MKQKATRIKNLHIEKKTSTIYLYDTCIQKTDNISILKIGKEKKIRQHNIIFDLIRIIGLYPRVKFSNYYEEKQRIKINEIEINISSAIEPNIKERNICKDLQKNFQFNVKTKSNQNKIIQHDISIKNNQIHPQCSEIDRKDKRLNNKHKIEIKNDKESKKIIDSYVNSELKSLVKNKSNIPFNLIDFIKITKDGNCFYRCLSYYFTLNKENYKEIKNIIIDWIENNYEKYINFFGDDDRNHISKEELAKREFDYIKSKDSWGSDYTITIACLLFDLDIGVYIYNGKDELRPYHFFENVENKNKDLLILSFHNNNHFDLIFSKNKNSDNPVLYNSIKEINVVNDIKKENLNNRVFFQKYLCYM